MNMVGPRRLQIMAALVLLAEREARQVTRIAAPACTVQMVRVDTVRLSDGRLLSVDAQSLATDAGSVIGVGSHAHLWPAGAFRGAGPVDEGSTIGFVREADGTFYSVPSPLHGILIDSPRVVSAGNGAWHVVFAVVRPGASQNALSPDSAEIWYGRLSEMKWHDITRVATLSHAYVASTLSSNLVVAGGSLNIAFPFDQSVVRNSNAPGNQGLILVRRVGTHWSLDTLRTWAGPDNVRLLAAPSGTSVVAAIVQSSFVDHHTRTNTVFLARYDGRWSTPRSVAGDGLSPVIRAPAIAWLSDRRLFLSWATAPGFDYKNPRVEWSAGTIDSLDIPPHEIARGAGADDFDAVVLDSRHALWLTSAATQRNAVPVFVSRLDGAVEKLAPLALPLDNPKPWAIRLSDSEAMVITSRLAASSADLVVATWATTLRLTCEPTRGSQ